MQLRHTTQSSLLLNHLSLIFHSSTWHQVSPSGSPAPSVSSNTSQQLIRNDRGNMLMMSDDNTVMKQIVETHAPDAREVDVKPLLHLVEDILKRATLQIDTTSQANAVSEDRTDHSDCLQGTWWDRRARNDDSPFQHASELFLGYQTGSDPSSFCSELWRVLAACQIYSSNQLAKSIAVLKQLPIILENSGPLKPHFDALNNLMKVVMDVAKCVVELKDLPPAYISHEVPTLSSAMAHVPAAVYWTVRSVLACAAQITSLTTMGYEFAKLTTEIWDLSTLAYKLSNILEHLRKQLATCYQYIDEKRNVLKALIYAKDDIQPLIDGSNKTRVYLDVLRRKNVLLLISGLAISNDELSILEQIYNESRNHETRRDSRYDVVWILIVNHSVQWTNRITEKFESLQIAMPWYTMYHPSLMEKAPIRFIREVWHFKNKPILVVLDPQGKVVCPNALHMMWIWGSNAFPFTSLREESLWIEETWRLELLVNGIDPVILKWIDEEKYIFLYGGDDVEWVRRFTNTARATAQAAGIPLEMVYVGKRSKREKIRLAIEKITEEKLSYAWQDLTMIWLFWTRLESMFFSKIQLGKVDDQDPMMQEIKKLLSYDREGGWAILSKGSRVVINGLGGV
ncbi:hypothetical protein OIU77_001901 [Salix suchowensis]|uniref:Protein SIEVE ELEMENT OCCLUSION B-like n=1 Tax=Salix suchowensis TaxID=1278906 RepID=A0ABQ9B570_9ROSI|nr:hypothetical protein OIU77_001901 [Salix suchowensis]